MTRDGLIKRLQAGKAVNFKYSKNGLCGIVNIWRYNDKYIITWEECEDGNQCNESSFTKDERYEFESIDEVIRFIDEHCFDIDNFKP
ncbi:hypothetical protein ABCY62_00660 [Acetivibrio clariflavus]|uniref:hypothetical protein n=1 Tax=Acetivibrio clariflavus TaxID=288965 RepID=UPI0031F5B3AA